MREIWATKEVDGEEWQRASLTYDDTSGEVFVGRWSENVPLSKAEAIEMAKTILEVL